MCSATKYFACIALALPHDICMCVCARMQESFPEARTKRRKRPVRGLPYSGPKCAALERALLEWLWELPVGGLQEKLGGNIQALIPAFRDGVLLADIALYITGERHTIGSFAVAYDVALSRYRLVRGLRGWCALVGPCSVHHVGVRVRVKYI